MKYLPICADCGVEMRCARNGQPVIRKTYGEATTVQSGDKYACPQCKSAVVVGMGKPVHSGEETFDSEHAAARFAEPVEVEWE
jgi:DNA-directed RNA polymerase subunit RPC12/RpoP